MHVPNLSTRIWSLITAVALAVFIALATDRAEASEKPHPQESQIVAGIQSYCAKSWRNANIPRAEWSDCSQQVLTELLERITRRQLARAILNSDSAERIELKRAIWRTVQRWIRAVRHVSLSAANCTDPTTSGSPSGEQDKITLVMEVAVKQLSPRQYRILCLLCEGRTVREISTNLQISARQVSDEKYRAIQKMRRYFAS